MTEEEIDKVARRVLELQKESGLKTTQSILTFQEVQQRYHKDIYTKFGTTGSIDIAVENIGYSEYTITGYSTENFKLGGHDLEKIFSSYIGKYVCIIIDKND